MRRNAILLSIILFLTTPLSAQEATKSDTTKTQKLKEVVVTHQKQLIKNDIDKLTYNVQEDVTSLSMVRTISKYKVLRTSKYIRTGIPTLLLQGKVSKKY